ncbi:MAG: hypothetical protein M5U28_36600 [Sandaracinaceae bacterium]|nr:hypothetical protein [Sandaracinaceae bacterium]
MARAQLRRDPWPSFEAFDASRYPEEVRLRSARQWWRRAREEYGSIHEFTALAHALCRARAPIDLLAALSRLVTDEARHAWLCAAMARALVPGADPESVFAWAPPPRPGPRRPRATIASRSSRGRATSSRAPAASARRSRARSSRRWPP